MRILAEDQDLQRRVRGDLALISKLVEETLRIEPPIPLMFRTVTRDTVLEGCHLQAGQRVALVFGAANRDPSVFDDSASVDIDRPHVRHLSFSAGPHRCIGSHLARLQIGIALEQLISRLGQFRIPEGARLRYVSRESRGLISMPIVFGGNF
jgi:cytochrome P450